MCKWKLVTQKDCSGTFSLDSAENITMAFPESSLKKQNVVTQCPARCCWAVLLCVPMYLSACLWTKLIYVRLLVQMKMLLFQRTQASSQTVYWVSSWHEPKALVLCTKSPQLVRAQYDGKQRQSLSSKICIICIIWSLNYKKRPKRCICGISIFVLKISALNTLIN